MENKEEISYLLEQKIQPINDLISKLYEIQLQEEYDKNVRNEWAQLSVVLDRFFLVFFMLFTTIVSILLFVN